jgi:hypothetical protein
MLSIFDRQPTRQCQGFSRREFLQVGGLGLLGNLTLPNLLRARAAAVAAGRPVKDKSVVFLFLQGGPSQIEFFDPKMTAPAEFRSVTGEVQTNWPGITFAGGFPRLARLTDKIAVVRSYASGNAGHEYLIPASGNNSLKATMGALYARVAGMNHPRTGIPNNILVLPEAVQPGLRLQGNFETSALPTLTSPGALGPSYAAFDPSGSAVIRRNMELRLTPSQFEERRTLLAALDTVRRDIDSRGIMTGVDTFSSKRSTSSPAAPPRPSTSPGKTRGPSPNTTRAIASATRTRSAGSTCAARPTCSASSSCSPAGCARRAAGSLRSRTAAGTCTQTKIARPT